MTARASPRLHSRGNHHRPSEDCCELGTLRLRRRLADGYRAQWSCQRGSTPHGRATRLGDRQVRRRRLAPTAYGLSASGESRPPAPWSCSWSCAVAPCAGSCLRRCRRNGAASEGVDPAINRPGDGHTKRRTRGDRRAENHAGDARLGYDTGVSNNERNRQPPSTGRIPYTESISSSGSPCQAAARRRCRSFSVRTPTRVATSCGSRWI